MLTPAYVSTKIRRQSYDAFWHLRHALFWKDNDLVFALTAYFDDSGKKESDLLVVGGYISTVRRWEIDLNPAWRLMLAKHHIAKEFKRYNFLRFPRPKDVRILLDFAGIINDYTTYAVACGIQMDDWYGANRKYQMARNHLYPYPICARTCVRLIREWCRDNSYAQNEVRYVFDDGSEHADHFGKLLKMDSDPEVRDIIPVPDSSKKIYPLQAADFFAWETRNQLRIDPDPVPTAASPALQKLLRIPARADVGVYHYQGLEDMCIKAKIPLRHPVTD